MTPETRASVGPADLFRTPDLIEPVVGFRSWRAIDGRLRSLYLPVFWDQRVMRAECPSASRTPLAEAISADAPQSASATAAALERPHMAPDPDCSCGIYTYFEPDYQFPTLDYRGVVGIVTLTGTIEVHADGMRGEEACVHALATYSRWVKRHRDEVAAIAEALEVDLVELEQLEEAAVKYGRPLSRGLLPAELPPEPPRVALPQMLHGRLA